MENLNEKEKRFENFINKTIVLASKKFFKDECTKNIAEQKLIDDERHENYIGQFIKYEESGYRRSSTSDLLEQIENVNLLKALKSLSDIEMIVIFLLFERQFTSDEASKILEICSDSVRRIKRRAIKKLQDYMKGEK